MSKFDIVIPLGESCNISYLLQSSKIKKETSLFEWFVSENLLDIMDVLKNVSERVNTRIGSFYTNKIFMNTESISSTHYTEGEYIPIYKRRAERLYENIKNNKRILFIRFVRDSLNTTLIEPQYTYDDFSKFVNIIQTINPDTSEMKLLFIRHTPTIKHIEHPFVIYKYYENLDVTDKSLKLDDSDITLKFINILKEIGYNIKNESIDQFTDKSEV